MKPSGRARSLAARVLERLPPRPAWLLWRLATVMTSARRRASPGPEVDVCAVAWGVDDFELERLIERLSERAASADRLLVVSDSDAVHVAAAAGCRFEHVPPGAGLLTEERHDQRVARRVLAVLADYRLDRVVVVGELPPALRSSLPEAEPLEPAAPAG